MTHHQINNVRAAILYKSGEPLEIKDLELPKLKEGQVLVKILYSGVCRSQLMEVKGKRGEDRWLPHLLGHEGAGIVVSMGKGVTKVKKGDEVILGWIKGKGLDAAGAQYKSDNITINSGRVTTFSNYSIISESRLTIKPNGLGLDEAILFGCALVTGSGMVLNEIKPSVESSVIVLGLGGIGLSVLIALKALNIKNIIALDISDAKLEMANQFGASYMLNTGDKNFLKLLREALPEGADYCFESAGLTDTIELGFSLIKTKGELIFASHPEESAVIKINPHELISGKKISGSWGGATKPDKDIPLMYKLINKSNINLKSILTKRYSLEQINDALDDLEAGNVFRPLIVMEHDE